MEIGDPSAFPRGKAEGEGPAPGIRGSAGGGGTPDGGKVAGRRLGPNQTEEDRLLDDMLQGRVGDGGTGSGELRLAGVADGTLDHVQDRGVVVDLALDDQ